MSRYVVRNDDDFRVVIGWDPPLQTFFIHVHNLTEKDEEKQIILWEGIRPGEIWNVFEISERITEWKVKIDDKTLMSLRQDQIRNR